MKFEIQAGDPIDINLTPLIDVVFLLLIFFMVSTTFIRESHLELVLPEANGKVDEKQTQVYEVVIGPDGSYTIDNNKLINTDIKTLYRGLKKITEGDLNKPIVITSDASAPLQSAISVMEVAGNLGITDIRISTQRPKHTAE